MADEIRGADRGSTPPSFDFDDDAISSLLDQFVETQTGSQDKHVSHPPDPADPGAQAAQRTLFGRAPRHSTLPLVGRDLDSKRRRVALLDALADRAAGSSKARILTSAAELSEQIADPEGALERYQSAQAADARDVVVLRAIQRLAMQQGRWRLAVDSLEKESSLDIAIAERVAALKLLAQILLAKLGDAAGAEQAALRAAELDRRDFVSWLVAARARLCRDDRAGGARALVAAAERWPSDRGHSTMLLHAAILLEEAQATEESRFRYERLVEDQPELLAAQLGVARTSVALGDSQAAIASLRAASLSAPASIADALRRTAAVITDDSALESELLTEASSSASAWTRAHGAALAGKLEEAVRALESQPEDRTVELEGLFAAMRSRYRSELGVPDADTVPAHPALEEYVEASRALGEATSSNANRLDPAERGAPSMVRRALEREHDFAAGGAVDGWTLALAETLPEDERRSALLAAEQQRPASRLLQYALQLSDPDPERRRARAAEADEALATSAPSPYPPSEWRGNGTPADLDTEALELDLSDLDPLSLEHRLASMGAHGREAAELLLGAAEAFEGIQYLRRTADAFLSARLPSEAARALRAACAERPDDPSLRTRRKDAELRASEFARLAEDAMRRARQAPDELEQLQAFSAMAEVDRLARGDMQSARLSLQSVAELRPDHIPTARALETDALHERDPERIRTSARRLLDALPEGSPERVARWRLTVELLRADADADQRDVDRVLRSIEEPLESDPGLARQVLGAAYAKNDTELAAHALIALQGSYGDHVERAALALEAANVLRDAGEIGQALEALNTAGDHPLALEAEAELLAGSKRWLDAARTFEDAAARAKDPRRAASLWREAARIFEEELDDETEALRTWRAAADADIRYLDVYRRLATLYQTLGQREELMRLTEQRIDAGADNPTLVALLLEQAVQRTAAGDLDGVLQALDDALELDPRNFKALQQLVQTHRARSDWQGAAEGLIRIARLKRSREEEVWAFSQLAEIYHEQLDDLDRAEASLRRALDLAPLHREALDRLASVLVQREKTREAARLLQVLAERATDEAAARDYRIRLSRAVELAGDARRAEAVFEELRIERPTDPDVILAFADYYRRQGAGPAEAMHLNRAANDLREAIDARPGDEGLWSTLVRVVHRRHGPGAASCVAGAAIAIGHSPTLFEGTVGSHGESQGQVKLPLPPRIDPILAPPSLPQTAQRLFALCEHAFDKMLPFDAAAWRLRRPSGAQRILVDEAGAAAEALGISEPRIRVTQVAPAACMPILGDPPTLVVGASLHELTTPEERFFLFARALKVAASQMAPALRARPEELDAALLALLLDQDPSRRHGMDPQTLQQLRKKLLRAVPRRWRDEVESLVLELRSLPAFSTRLVPFAVSNFGDRAALVLTGDTPAAVSGLLKIAGHEVPAGHGGRLQAVAGTPEAIALVRFAISDSHFEARAQAGVDR
jgi:hypothetical protein